MKKIVFFLLLCSFLIIDRGIFGKELKYSKLKKPLTKFLPTSVTVNPQGEIFAVDGFTGSIIKYNSKWRYQYTLKVEEVNSIVDLFYYNNYVYALSGEGKLFRLDSKGNIDFYKEYERGSLLGQLITPRSFYMDDEGIYISDSGNNRIQTFHLDGSLSSSFGYKTYSISGFLFNTGISKMDENILVADSGSKEVKIFNKDGFYVNNLRDESGSEFIFLSPESVFVDEDKYIYVIDSGKNQLYIYSPKGTLVRLGKQGSKATEFYSIKDIWVEGDYIYIADTLNKKIKILNKNTYEFVKAIGASNFMKLSSLSAIIFVLFAMVFILKRIGKKKVREKHNE